MCWEATCSATSALRGIEMKPSMEELRTRVARRLVEYEKLYKKADVFIDKWCEMFKDIEVLDPLLMLAEMPTDIGEEVLDYPEGLLSGIIHGEEVFLEDSEGDWVEMNSL